MTDRISTFDTCQYGAVGDGTTDDTDAIQAAIDAASDAGGGTVFIPAGKYLCGGLNLPSYVTLIGQGEASRLIQRADTEPIICAIGTERLCCDVGAYDIQMSQTVMNIANSQANLAPGNLVVLYDKKVYDPNGTTTASGEILEVSWATPNTLSVRQQVRGAFTAGRIYQRSETATIHKIENVTGVTVSKLGFQGRLTATVPIINTYYLRNARFDDLTCFQGGDNFLSLKVAKNVVVDRLIIENLVDDIANSHFGYGVHVSNAADGITISNVVASNLRHAVTTTGGGKGIPRNITITNCVVSGCNTAAGIDTHSAADNVLIENCVVTSCAIGITIRGKNVSVIGNEIRQCPTGVRIAETLVENAVVRGNTITGSQVGIDASDACTDVHLHENSILGFTLMGIRVAAPISNLEITLNTLKNGNLGGMSILSTCTGLVAGNTLIDMCRTGADSSITVVGSAGSGRLDFHANRFVSRVSTLTGRCVNASRATQVVGNTAFGLFTSGNKWNATVGGVTANQAGNNEYA